MRQLFYLRYIVGRGSSYDGCDNGPSHTIFQAHESVYNVFSKRQKFKSNGNSNFSVCLRASGRICCSIRIPWRENCNMSLILIKFEYSQQRQWVLFIAYLAMEKATIMQVYVLYVFDIMSFVYALRTRANGMRCPASYLSKALLRPMDERKQKFGHRVPVLFEWWRCCDTRNRADSEKVKAIRCETLYCHARHAERYKVYAAQAMDGRRILSLNTLSIIAKHRAELPEM